MQLFARIVIADYQSNGIQFMLIGQHDRFKPVTVMQQSLKHCTELSQFYFTSLSMWLKIFMFRILILKACSVLLLLPLSWG